MYAAQVRATKLFRATEPPDPWDSRITLGHCAAVLLHNCNTSQPDLPGTTWAHGMHTAGDAVVCGVTLLAHNLASGTDELTCLPVWVAPFSQPCFLPSIAAS